MKKLFPLAFLLFCLSAQAQNTCCSAPKLFADLGSATEFQEEHQLPKTTKLANHTGKFVEFETPDEKKGRGYLIKALKPSTKYLFVFHEWWGLNENMLAEAENWAKDLPNVNVIALDLYDGKVATTREAATEFMQGASEERIRNIIQGATDLAGPKAEIATLGYCFGGGWSMQAALQLEYQAVGCVIYYGMPEHDSTLLKGLSCKVLGIFAEKDKWINRKVVGEYEQAMNKEKKAYETYWYNAEHAFANPSNPVFDEVATKDARAKTKNYLVQVFK